MLSLHVYKWEKMKFTKGKISLCRIWCTKFRVPAPNPPTQHALRAQVGSCPVPPPLARKAVEVLKMTESLLLYRQGRCYVHLGRYKQLWPQISNACVLM